MRLHDEFEHVEDLVASFGIGVTEFGLCWSPGGTLALLNGHFVGFCGDTPRFGFWMSLFE